MRDYGKVSPNFWIGDTGRRIRDAGRDCQVVALYLLTCPSSNMIGLYYLPLATLQHETGLGRAAALRALQRLQDIGFASWDPTTQTAFVTEMAAHQIGEPLKPSDKQCKGVERAWTAMKSSPFYRPFYARYKASYHLPRPHSTRPTEGPSKPLRSQEQEQEQIYPIQEGERDRQGVEGNPLGASVIPLTRAAR